MENNNLFRNIFFALLIIAFVVTGGYYAGYKAAPKAEKQIFKEKDSVIVIKHDTITFDKIVPNIQIKYQFPDTGKMVQIIAERDSLTNLLKEKKVDIIARVDTCDFKNNCVSFNYSVINNLVYDLKFHSADQEIVIKKIQEMVPFEVPRAWYNTPWFGFCVGVISTITAIALLVL